MMAIVHKLGVPTREQEYSAAELKVIERHARMVFSGGMQSITEAVKSCRQELGNRRTATALRSRIKALVAGKGIPRSHGFMLDSELEVVRKYVDKVAAGEIESWMDAAEPCHAELERLQAEAARNAPMKVRKTYGRDVLCVYGAIVRMATLLGHRRKIRHRWTEEEERLCESWRRWYLKYRNVRKLKPLTQSADGLQEDLARLGVERTLRACAQHIARVQVQRPERVVATSKAIQGVVKFQFAFWPQCRHALERAAGAQANGQTFAHL